MRHIRQINSVGTDSYTVVIAEEPLENHESIIQYPDLFEISEDEIPEQFQYAKFNETTVPDEVQLWRIRTILKLSNLETQVETVLNSLPEPSKTAANYIWNYGTTVERNSQTVVLIQNALEMTNEQIDDLFIQSNKIIL